MSKRHSTATTGDDADKRQKSSGTGLGEYTLVLADGSVQIDTTVSSSSRLISQAGLAGHEIPMPNFNCCEAQHLVAFMSKATSSVADDDGANAPNVAPDAYVKLLHLCDFLGMEEVVTTKLLKWLDPPAPADPLAFWRACHTSLPIFPRLLHQRCDAFDSEEQAAVLVAKIASSPPHDLTYYELSICDGLFCGNKKHVGLVRFATAERERRQSIINAAKEKTNTLRKDMKDDMTGDSAEDSFRVQVWQNGGSFAKEMLSKQLLDQEMWKAIEQGNVDVAKRLLELGAEPALTHDPRLNPADEDAHERLMDGDDQIIERHTSLMVATSREDLNTMRFLLDNGVEANFCQPQVPDEYGAFGGFNALWVATSTEAMRLLLERGADPNQACALRPGGEGSSCTVGKIIPTPLLLHQAQFDKLLIRHGADPNAFTVDTNDPSEGYPAYVDEAYWPKQLAEAVDLKWCEELLTDHGADPNWPVDCFVETIEGRGELPVQGLSVLLHAVLKGNIPVVRLLLKHKADPNQFEIEVYSTCSYDMLVYYTHDGRQYSRNQSGDCETVELRSPLSIALDLGNQEMIDLLKSHGATKVNKEEDDY